MTPLNNPQYDRLEQNADLYTDEYVIFQHSTEDLQSRTGYIEVYDAAGEKPVATMDIQDGDPLDNALFRAGNNIFARELDRSGSIYSFTIYDVSVSPDMRLSAGRAGILR